MRCAPAGLHEGEGRRRPGPAGQRQRRLRHRRELAAARRGAVARRAARWPSCSPTTNIPHLYMPFREGSAFDSEVPADHVHGPLYLEFDEGVEHFAKVLAGLVPPGATVAVDELTGAMRRAAGRLFPAGPPSDAALGGRSGQAGEDGRPDLLRPQGVSHHRSRPSSTSRSRWRPVCGRSTCRRHSCGARSNSAPRRT